MVGRSRSDGKARSAPASGRGRTAPPAPTRRALGNDPFTRGAASRTPVAPVVVLEREAAHRGGARPPPDSAAQTGDGTGSAPVADPGTARDELGAALGALLPALRRRLAAAGDFFRILEPPGRLDRFGMDPALVERAAPLLDFLYATWWRVQTVGLEQVPATGPVIVVANHGGTLPWDALMLRHALRRDHPAKRDLRPLLDDVECDRPSFGGAAVRLGAVRAGREAADVLLAQGGCLAVFPEGSGAALKPWRERYRLLRFGRGGFVKAALRSGAAIVPCAIVGSEEASPALARTGWLAEALRLPLLTSSPALRLLPAGMVPLPARWRLRFDPPMSLGGRGLESAADPDFVAATNEAVRARIQAMLDEALADRRSVYL